VPGLALLAALALTRAAGGAGPGQAPTPRSLAETFLAGLQRGDTGPSLDRLFRGSRISRESPQQFELLKRQVSTGLPAYGRILGYELVREEQYGTAVVRLVYLVRAEKHPTVWEFFFYRPHAEWFLANFTFNDQFNGLR
jgi:hypothetical protein